MTGPLAQLFAQVRNLIERDGRFPPSPTVEWPSKDTALAALSSIERHVQEDAEEWEQIAAEKGLPFLLDHLGLDGLANEVVAQKRHVRDMEKALGCDHHKTAWTFIEYEGESWNACQDCGLLEKWAGGQRFAQRVDPAALPAREKEEE